MHANEFFFNDFNKALGITELIKTANVLWAVTLGTV
jgi:hypothetical protein